MNGNGQIVENKNRRFGAKVLAAAAVLGGTGGAVRAAQLLTFDEKGLPVGGEGLHIAVWAISAVWAAVAAVLWLCIRKKTVLEGDAGASSKPEAVLSLICAVILGLAAAVRFAMSYSPFSIWGILLAAACFASAAVMPAVIRGLGSRTPCDQKTRLLSLIPVAAMSLQLIEFYRSVAKNPTASWYASDVFAGTALVLLLFSFAGAINERSGVKKVLVMGFAAVSFGLTALVGRVVDIVSDIGAGAGLGILVAEETFECLLFAFGIAAAAAAIRAVCRRGEASEGADADGAEQ